LHTVLYGTPGCEWLADVSLKVKCKDRAVEVILAVSLCVHADVNSG